MAWSLPLDRMRVMAALETLTRHWDPVAARDVVVAFHGIPKFPHRGTEWRWRAPGGRDTVEGLTDLGPVRQSSESPGTSHSLGAPGEGSIVRIGRFKVYGIRKKRYPSVVFYDFRSDTRIPGELPGERWQLLYDVVALKPLILSRLVPAPGRMSWRDTLVCWCMTVRYGVRVRFETHHLTPVVMHSELPEDNA